jgi:NADH-quinone oxidoreductase subunit C
MDGDIRTPIPTVYGDHAKKFHETWMTQIEFLKKKHGTELEEVWMPGEHATEVPIVFVKKESIVEVMSTLKKDLKYGFLSDLSCTDESPSQKRFEIVYQLLSHERFIRIRVKVRVAENEKVPTIISVWSGANWAEREVFDMFGVSFSGHPDLRRILMDMRWQGHPLRKDYPLRGYQVFPSPEPIDINLLEKQ